MKDSKNLVIGMLCAVVCIMAVAYAAFATTLTINGTATVASNWKVEITNIQCTPTTAANGVAIDVETSKSATTAQFDIDFQQPGDQVVCDVTIKNSGSLPAVVATNGVIADGDEQVGIEPDTELVNGTDDAITFEVSGVKDGDKLAANGEVTYKIIAKFRDLKDEKGNSIELSESQKKRNFTVTINYEQDLTVTQ